MGVISIGLFVLAVISGMLGLGVAFAAIPFLSFFLQDLVHQVQPLSLLLNGITALFAVFGFAKSGYIVWKKALGLAVVATIAAPVGSYLAQFIPPTYIWVVYLASVTFLVYRIFKPVKSRVDRKDAKSMIAATSDSPVLEKSEEYDENRSFKLALMFAIPISILSGLLGVGPGFLLMPTLIILGFEPKMAAGINAFAVCPPSFSALIPHLSTAQWDFRLTAILLVVGAIGSFIGARITSVYVSGQKLKKGFGILIIIMTAYKLFTILT